MRQLPQLPPLAADRLVAAGRELDLHGWVRRSLAPGRELAGELVAVCSAAALPDDDDATLVALAEGVAELCAAQRQSFPDNLCCDLEFLVAQALRRARVRARACVACAVPPGPESYAGAERRQVRATSVRRSESAACAGERGTVQTC